MSASRAAARGSNGPTPRTPPPPRPAARREHRAHSLARRHIKGYLSHQHAKLVVSKGNAFPPLREVLEQNNA